MEADNLACLNADNADLRRQVAELADADLAALRARCEALEDERDALKAERDRIVHDRNITELHAATIVADMVQDRHEWKARAERAEADFDSLARELATMCRAIVPSRIAATRTECVLAMVGKALTDSEAKLARVREWAEETTFNLNRGYAQREVRAILDEVPT